MRRKPNLDDRLLSDSDSDSDDGFMRDRRAIKAGTFANRAAPKPKAADVLVKAGAEQTARLGAAAAKPAAAELPSVRPPAAKARSPRPSEPAQQGGSARRTPRADLVRMRQEARQATKEARNSARESARESARASARGAARPSVRVAVANGSSAATPREERPQAAPPGRPNPRPGADSPRASLAASAPSRPAAAGRGPKPSRAAVGPAKGLLKNRLSADSGAGAKPGGAKAAGALSGLSKLRKVGKQVVAANRLGGYVKTDTGRKPEEARKKLEKKQLKAVWRSIDIDGGGTLDRDELREVLKKMGKKLSASQLTRTMNEIDGDGSGEVEFHEFEAWWDREMASNAAVPPTPFNFGGQCVRARKKPLAGRDGEEAWWWVASDVAQASAPLVARPTEPHRILLSVRCCTRRTPRRRKRCRRRRSVSRSEKSKRSSRRSGRRWTRTAPVSWTGEQIHSRALEANAHQSSDDAGCAGRSWPKCSS